MMEPNAFESAILETIARERPSLALDVHRVQVRRRKFSGVGSYTDFVCPELGQTDTVPLKANIAIPGVRGGVGAVLVCRGREPACLETFTRADEFWTGAFEGFSVG